MNNQKQKEKNAYNLNDRHYIILSGINEEAMAKAGAWLYYMKRRKKICKKLGVDQRRNIKSAISNGKQRWIGYYFVI